jgi:protease I
MYKKAIMLIDKEAQDEEYVYPYYRLQEAGFNLDVVSTSTMDIKCKYGIPVKVTYLIDETLGKDISKYYDVLVIPGGWSPERVRMNKQALNVVVHMHASKKIIAAICHGPQVLLSAGISRDKKMTCFVGMKDDMVHAGAVYVDEPVVIHGNIITSPHYKNNPEWMRETLRVYDEYCAKEYAVH